MSAISDTIRAEQLVDAFKDSVGEGKAADIVEEAAREAGVDDKRRYEKEEAMSIADEISGLDDVSSFVRTSATTLKTRIRAGNL